MTRLSALFFATNALALTACSVSEPADNTSAAAQTSAQTAASGGVERETVERVESPVTPIAPAAAIASQPGPGGTQIDLTSLRVTGDILTATFRCSSAERFNSQAFRLPDVNLVDDTTSQRISVLRDNAGTWLASNPRGDLLTASCGAQPGIFWVRFPAPPATSTTVSIALPNTGPFDGMPVTR